MPNSAPHATDRLCLLALAPFCAVPAGCCQTCGWQPPPDCDGQACPHCCSGREPCLCGAPHHAVHRHLAEVTPAARQVKLRAGACFPTCHGTELLARAVWQRITTVASKTASQRQRSSTRARFVRTTRRADRVGPVGTCHLSRLADPEPGQKRPCNEDRAEAAGVAGVLLARHLRQGGTTTCLGPVATTSECGPQRALVRRHNPQTCLHGWPRRGEVTTRGSCRQNRDGTGTPLASDTSNDTNHLPQRLRRQKA